MRAFFQELLDVLVPSRRARVKQEREQDRLFIHEFKDLNQIETLPCSTDKLRKLDHAELSTMFSRQDLADEWDKVEAELQTLELPEFTGGVNPGDQRAIYYLVRNLCPQKILEVGTHIGCSTINAALAAKHLRTLEDPINTTIVSVDIRDVNDEANQPWRDAGAKYSPAQLMVQSKCDGFVRFISSPSLDFLRSDDGDEFDYIFLDGDHSATAVYQELPTALQRLRPGGSILLHDFFPDYQALWNDGSMIPGVLMAKQRLQNEGAEFDVLPLGVLPWPTKLNSNVTSLALVVRRD